MMMLLFFIAFCSAEYELKAECKRANYKKGKEFNGCNYNIMGKYPDDTPYEPEHKELYERAKCTTCCRVLFVSEYDVETGKKFDAQGDIDDHTRYTMDLEFDDLANVRTATGNYEQCILARPLEAGKTNQYWEFAPYMMYISFNLPRRVHDVRSSASPTHKLIIWKKKAPLDAGTNNQRFVYIHPYTSSYYPTTGSHPYTRGAPYPKHFFVPFQYSHKLCYEIVPSQSSSQTWTGNSGYKFSKTNGFQIMAQTCTNEVNKIDKQLWVPVFA